MATHIGALEVVRDLDEMFDCARLCVSVGPWAAYATIYGFPGEALAVPVFRAALENHLQISAVKFIAEEMSRLGVTDPWGWF